MRIELLTSARKYGTEGENELEQEQKERGGLSSSVVVAGLLQGGFRLCLMPPVAAVVGRAGTRLDTFS